MVARVRPSFVIAALVVASTLITACWPGSITPPPDGGGPIIVMPLPLRDPCAYEGQTEVCIPRCMSFGYRTCHVVSDEAGTRLEFTDCTPVGPQANTCDGGMMGMPDAAVPDGGGDFPAGTPCNPPADTVRDCAGSMACARVLQVCDTVSRTWTGCGPFGPNTCDAGVADSGCSNGAVQGCVSACGPGTQTCAGGMWGICMPAVPCPDAGTDAAVDVQPDVVADVGTDAPADTAMAPDAGTDAAADVGTEAAVDAAPEAAPDAAPDVAADVPPDSGCVCPDPFALRVCTYACMTSIYTGVQTCAMACRGDRCLPLGPPPMDCIGLPDAGTDASPEAGADAASDVPADLPPETAVDAGTDVGADVPADVAPDVAPDVAMDAGMDAASDVATDAMPDAAPEAAADVTPETGMDVAMDTAADSALDAGTDAPADAPAESATDVMDAAAEASPEAGADAATDAPTDVVIMPIIIPSGMTTPPMGMVPRVPPPPNGMQTVVWNDPSHFLVITSLTDCLNGVRPRPAVMPPSTRLYTHCYSTPTAANTAHLNATQVATSVIVRQFNDGAYTLDRTGTDVDGQRRLADLVEVTPPAGATTGWGFGWTVALHAEEWGNLLNVYPIALEGPNPWLFYAGSLRGVAPSTRNGVLTVSELIGAVETSRNPDRLIGVTPMCTGGASYLPGGMPPAGYLEAMPAGFALCF